MTITTETLRLAAKAAGVDICFDEVVDGAFIKGSCPRCQAGAGDPPADCVAPDCMIQWEPHLDGNDAGKPKQSGRMKAML